MTVVFVIWLAATMVELALYYVLPADSRKNLGAALAILLLAFALGGSFGLEVSGYTVTFGLLGAYRIFNILRFILGRISQSYRLLVVRQTFLALFAMQLGVAGMWRLSELVVISDQTFWIVLAGLQALTAAVALASVTRTLRRTIWPPTRVHFTDKELPTITVAVPARNETDDLHACLQSIIASDYPKLEILVLDDCSQTRRTPEIIRSFAHAGVRFLQGTPPPETWLAKNWAYEQLTREASGDYILFCGVDVRFSRHSLMRFITVMLERKKSFISVLPERSPQVYGMLSLIQPMRYWWELVPPRRLFNRPPVLSTCWMIEADSLRDAGGFAAAKRAILPEAYFAKRATQRDAYSFMRSNRNLGIYSMKRISEQRATATRTRYPQVHRRPEQVALLSLLEIVLLILPFFVAVSGFWTHTGTVAQVLAAIACFMLIATHELVAVSTRVNSWWFGLLAAPLMFVTDVFYVHYSMWRYEFSAVDWKGRNISGPVMGAARDATPAARA